MEHILHAKDFGASGDGIADDTDALVDLLAVMKMQGKPALLGGDGATATYLIDCGALEWTGTSTTENEAGPTLYTAGRVVLKAKSGTAEWRPEDALCANDRRISEGRFGQD